VDESLVAAYRADLHVKLGRYRGRELEILAKRAELSRAAVYRLRAHEHANVRLDTLQKLERALGYEALPKKSL
jgi:DNA-binding Xre family transcriptional regulator